MDDYESSNHRKWNYKYNVVFIPKYRRKVLYGQLRQTWARCSARSVTVHTPQFSRPLCSRAARISA